MIDRNHSGRGGCRRLFAFRKRLRVAGTHGYSSAKSPDRFRHSAAPNAVPKNFPETGISPAGDGESENAQDHICWREGAAASRTGSNGTSDTKQWTFQPRGGAGPKSAFRSVCPSQKSCFFGVAKWGFRQPEKLL